MPLPTTDLGCHEEGTNSSLSLFVFWKHFGGFSVSGTKIAWLLCSRQLPSASFFPQAVKCLQAALTEEVGDTICYPTH